MAPIFRLFHMIFAHYFNDFLDYDYIQQLQLPLWFYTLVGVFVLAIILWIILVVRILKNVVLRYINSTNCLKDDVNTAAIRSHTPGTSIQNDDEFSGATIWTHIQARPSIHTNNTIEHKMSTENISQQSIPQYT